MSEDYFPAWTQARLVSDAVFAEAYGALSGPRRAWLKKTIAQIHALSGPMRGPCERKLCEHRQGFASQRASCPLKSAVLFLDDTCTSAAMAVAAAVPMLLSGVPNLCAVRITKGAPLADDVLAGLELVGLEMVVHLDDTSARKFMEFLVADGSSAVLFHGQGAALEQLRTAAGYALPSLRLWKPFLVDRVGVYDDGAATWDWELLSWVHPCASIEIYGSRTAVPGLPSGCVRVGGDFEALLAGGYPALYVPLERLAQVAATARIALAPGQEGCWAWPGLGTDFFRTLSLALNDLSE